MLTRFRCLILCFAALLSLVLVAPLRAAEDEAPPAPTKPSAVAPDQTEGEKAEPADDAPDSENTDADEGEDTDSNDDDQPEQQPDEILAGHSAHGQAFNEGPRQKAYLMRNEHGEPLTGNVHFPITTNNPLVQQFFDQGVGQLHGFWYLEAERSFRHAASIEPDCAMLYWGMAMANLSNGKRARGFIEKAEKLKAAASTRERLYIDAVSAYVNETDRKKDKKRRQKFVAALEQIVKQFPDDIEAKAFLGVTYWANKRKLKIEQKKADAVLRQVLEVNPLHPAHHYRIHLWDKVDAAKALPNAAKCGEAAPGIAHMWHMPGHIYDKLKRYHDAAWQQEASARVDHAHMMRDRVMPDQIHNYAHNNEWLCRSLMNVGRVSDAIDLAKNMIELPRHPKYNKLSGRGSANYGRTRLYEALYRFEMWDQMLALTDSAYLDPTDDDNQQIQRLRARGVAYFGTFQTEKLKTVVKEMEDRLAPINAEQEKAGEEAAAKARDEEKDDKEIDKAKNEARAKFNGRIEPIEKALTELRAHVAYADGNLDEAGKLYDQAKDMDKARLALCHLRLGNHEQAEKLADEHVKKNPNEAQPLAVQAHVQHAIGKTDDAKKTFGELRKMSSALDMSSPVFARLEPIARSLNITGDWRVERTIPDDFGDRPPLASLGPFRWQPTAAESWTLPDDKGGKVSLSDYRGKPVIVIFYLGYGCVHCTEQLAAFHPMTEKFKKAGIELVGVSTDSVEDLKKALAPAKAEGGFPFPLLSDAELKVFKQYRAFDDFENVALHGTFLIDAAGRVRWQDISYEPFMDAAFLLEEAQRLLAMEVEKVARGE